MLPVLARVLLATRFLLMVFFFGLAFGLALFALRFLAKLWSLAGSLTSMAEDDFLIALLHLVDYALVASLVVIVALSSYDSLVARLQDAAEDQDLRWVARTDTANLKLKVATAIVAISSIHLLQVFLKVESYDDRGVMLRMALHGVFIAGALLLGVLDRITRKDPAAAHKNESA